MAVSSILLQSPKKTLKYHYKWGQHGDNPGSVVFCRDNPSELKESLVLGKPGNHLWRCLTFWGSGLWRLGHGSSQRDFIQDISGFWICIIIYIYIYAYIYMHMHIYIYIYLEVPGKNKTQPENPPELNGKSPFAHAATATAAPQFPQNLPPTGSPWPPELRSAFELRNNRQRVRHQSTPDSQKNPKETWVCLKMLCTPLYPMVLLIIIPIKWLFHWEYTQHFQTNPLVFFISQVRCSALHGVVDIFPLSFGSQLGTGHWFSHFQCWPSGCDGSPGTQFRCPLWASNTLVRPWPISLVHAECDSHSSFQWNIHWSVQMTWSRAYLGQYTPCWPIFL